MKISFVDNLPKAIPDDLGDREKYDSITLASEPLDDRTQARGVALQILYEKDLSDHPLNLIVKDRLSQVDLSQELAEFAVRIVAGTYPNIAMIDSYLLKFAPEWPIDKIAVIDRNIIRMTVWEFAIAQITPIRVAINESVELAKYFGSDSSGRFVHGVLGKLSMHIDEIKAAAVIQ